MSAWSVWGPSCPPVGRPNHAATMIAESPTPHLPRGAGGPPRRAAGRVAPGAGRPRSSSSRTRSRGCWSCRPSRRWASAWRRARAPAARASRPRPCSSRSRRRTTAAASAPRRVAAPPGDPAPLVVGYGACAAGLLSAHRAHRCADVVLRLTAAAGLPRFAHLPAADAVAAAGLTEREADVLVLLLRGLTTAAVGARLCISASTARTHCRAVLRKLGAGDRRALRALLLAGDARGLPRRPRQLCRGIGRGGSRPRPPYLRTGRGRAARGRSATVREYSQRRGSA